MEEDNQTLKRALEAAINKHVRGRADASKIEAIMWANYERKRVENYVDSGNENTPEEYVLRVIACYEHDHHFVECVQKGDDEIWLEMYPQMQRWAYAYLLKKGFYPGKDTFELAASYAGEAGGILVNAHYPYDLDFFDAWAYQILLNTCKRNMRQAISKDRIPDGQLVGLDTPELSKMGSLILDYVIERSIDLENAFAQLTVQEQQLITLLLEGASTKEIALKLDITPDNVYHMKHIIIKKLRKILGVDDDE